MSCPVPFEELSAFADGELEAARELDLRRHLDGCARCRAQVAALQQLKVMVGQRAGDEPVPPAISRAVRLGDSQPRRRPPRWLLGAAALAAAVMLVAWPPGAPKPDPFTTALVADHIHYAHNPERLEVSESDPQALERWFASRLPFDPQLPEIPGAHVVGGRLCTLRGNRLALAFFDKEGESLSIFVGDASGLTPDADRAWSAADREDRCSEALSGYRVCYDRRGRVVTAVVGPTLITPSA
jgi:anti-sigma factor RsiW